jgi:hypothetical protein
MWKTRRFSAAYRLNSQTRALPFAAKVCFLGGAAVYRCDKSFVLTGASAPEVRAAEFFSKLLSRAFKKSGPKLFVP